MFESHSITCFFNNICSDNTNKNYVRGGTYFKYQNAAVAGFVHQFLCDIKRRYERIASTQ